MGKTLVKEPVAFADVNRGQNTEQKRGHKNE